MKQEILGKAIFAGLILLLFAWAATGSELKQGLDLQGGVKILVKADFVASATAKSAREGKTITYSTGEKAEMMDNLQSVLERRLNATGLAEISIRRLGKYKFQIEVPGADESEGERLRNIIERPGTLEFMLMAIKDPLTGENIDVDRFKDVTDPADLPKTFGDEAEPGWEDFIFFEVNDPSKVSNRGLGIRAVRFYPLLNPLRNPDIPVLRGDNLAYVGRTTDQQGAPAISFRFDAATASKFADLTEKYSRKGDQPGSQLVIIVDGKIHSAPGINSRIDGQGIIEGFSGDDLHSLLIALRNGSLEVPLKVEATSVIGPSLGRVQIEQSKKAILYGFSLVCLFILGYYRLSGMIAVFALMFNLLIIIGTMKVFGATMTLPGIAGILLTVGMSVDANILIYERIREELARGKTLRQGIMNGYGRAFVTIFDANMTTLITAFILYQFGTGPIRGFAITLSIGILASMFTALYCTRIIFDWLVNSKIISTLKMVALFKKSAIDFMKYKGMAMVFSVAMILFGTVMMAYEGKDMLGIDFKGGSSLIVHFKQAMSLEDLRTEVGDFTNKDDSSKPRYPGLNIISTFNPNSKQTAEAGKGFQFEVTTLSEDLQGLEKDIRHLYSDNLVVDAFDNVVLRPGGDVIEPDERGDLKLPTIVQIQFNLQFDKAISKSEVQGIFEGAGDRFKDPEINFGSENDQDLIPVTILTGEIDLTQAFLGKNEGVEGNYQHCVTSIYNAFKDKDYFFVSPFPSKELIGATVSGELFWSAAYSLILAIICIVIYIYIRFNEWKFGLAAVVALLHDILITLGFMAIAVAVADTAIGQALGLGEIEINLPIVGVLLTIIGYSLNDTIVVFDRIRENLRGSRRDQMGEVINTSINQTLSRTVLTSGTTFITVLTLFLIGGKVIHDISFALCVGIVVGTYSSIFIASPILVFWNPEAPKDKKEAATTAANAETVAAGS